VIHVVHVNFVAATQKQNITLQLDRETIRRAKVIAAHRGTSVSQLVTDTIEGIVRDDERYESARARALSVLKRGFHMGAGRRATRDELHDR
jgi:hypothetical protein